MSRCHKFSRTDQKHGWYRGRADLFLFWSSARGLSRGRAKLDHATHKYNYTAITGRLQCNMVVMLVVTNVESGLWIGCARMRQ